MRSGVAGKKVGVLIQQVFGSGGSAIVQVDGPVITLGTAFQKYTVTFDVPSIAGKIYGTNDNLLLCFFYSDDRPGLFGGQLINQTGLFELGQVQFEKGEVATEFDFRPYELSLCRRYCIVDRNGSNGASRMNVGVAFFFGSNTAYIPYSYPTMRTVPAVTISAASNWRILNNGGATNVSAISAAEVSLNRMTVTATVSGQTAGYSGILQSVDGATSGTGILLDAEL
ncbi:hypothetical protein ABW42_03445 [Stenotrophomonas maltophilia]|nr:hypothetical protein ABW42_03445 [Stenotrophomonas maltophilia]